MTAHGKATILVHLSICGLASFRAEVICKRVLILSRFTGGLWGKTTEASGTDRSQLVS